MVHRCCISSCGMNVRVAEAKGLSYHGFPIKEPLREQWIQAIIPHLEKPESFKVVPKYTRVCSRHFRKKDYSVDIKKRARLNSNAVPSVFPRKNSPIIVPNVLSSPNRSKIKTEITCTTQSQNDQMSSTTHYITLPSTPTSDGNHHQIIFTVQKNGEAAIEGTIIPGYIIDTSVLSDSTVTLTLCDPDVASSSSQSQEDLSQSSNLSLNENEDSNEAPQKKRKRRKWNRSACDRPPKGKKKVSSDEVNIDGVGEALAEIRLSKFLQITTSDLQENPQDSSNADNSSAVLIEPTGTERTNSLQSISLPLDTCNVRNMRPDQVQHLNSIEQELLQSIQAVSLHGGEPDANEAPEAGTLDDKNQLRKGLSTYVFQHSNDHSIFPDGNQNISATIIRGNENISLVEHPCKVEQTDLSTSESDIMAQFVDVGLDDRASTIVEIDRLANHLNSSLLTNPPITLAINGIDDLSLARSTSVDQESTASSSTEDIDQLFYSNTLDLQDQFSSYPDSGREDDSEYCIAVKSNSISRKKKSVEDVRLIGVTKKHRKEKMCGRFSVERFSNSDKDIEYYTGFSSYRQFENFFRSLEAYVERLRVTNVMFGVTNLDKLSLSGSTNNSDNLNSATLNSTDEFISPLPPPPAFDEPQKRRPFHGRSMTRIDELFMTVIRLKRKLPEKVLGHMFCISQPTVSRIIRAWTVLLSKLIDRYPVENAYDKSKDKLTKNSAKSISEHCYTSRGLCVPESFKQLFHSDLAQTITITSVNAKDKKTSQAKDKQHSSISKRSRKSRVEVEDCDNVSENSHQNILSVSTVTESELDAAVESLLSPSQNLLEDNELFQDVNFISNLSN